MYDERSKLYSGYIDNMQRAEVKTIPFESYKSINSNQNYCNFSAIYRADEFLNSIKRKPESLELDDIFSQKLDLSQDNTNLILDEIHNNETVKNDNLSRLYDDLFCVSKWRNQIPFPENYAMGKSWMDFNKMELGLKDQIRREIKDSMKSVAFNEKDLRESLLDLKKQSQKNQMMGSMLEDTIHDQQHPEGGKYNIQGDNYWI